MLDVTANLTLKIRSRIYGDKKTEADDIQNQLEKAVQRGDYSELSINYIDWDWDDVEIIESWEQEE